MSYEINVSTGDKYVARTTKTEEEALRWAFKKVVPGDFAVRVTLGTRYWDQLLMLAVRVAGEWSLTGGEWFAEDGPCPPDCDDCKSVRRHG